MMFKKNKQVGIFLCFFHKVKQVIYLIIEEYEIEKTKIKFYDDYIVEDADAQKEYIDNIIAKLLSKF